MAIVLIRTLIIYLCLLAAMRLLGKRQMGEMELSEFVLASLIADLAAHPLQDIGIPLINGIVPVLTLFCCEVLIAGLSMKSIKFRALLFGTPSMLIQKGRIMQPEMHSNRFTPDELMQALRSKGIFDISQVHYAILETNGTLNVMPCNENTGIPAEYPCIVISKGRILDNNLRWLGFDRRWLESRLKAAGQADADRIYLMTADRNGKTYIEQMEDIS